MTKSDKLIKNVLNASLICEGIFCGLYIIAYCLMRPLFELFDPILWQIQSKDYTTGSDTELTMKIFFPTILFVLASGAVFYLVWSYISKMTDQQKFCPEGGAVLALFCILRVVLEKLLFRIEMTAASENGSRALAARSVFNQMLSFLSNIHFAALILAFMAFAMMWHKRMTYNDQTI